MTSPTVLVLLALSQAAAGPASAVTGTVATRDGTPIERARVRWLVPPGVAAPETTAGRDGRFTLAPPALATLPPLEASAAGFHASRAASQDLPLAIVLLRASAIRGRVASLDPRLVAAHAQVTLDRGARPPVRVECAPDGSFLLEGVAPGRYTLEAKAPDFVARSLAFELGPDLVDAGLIELDPGPRLRGQAVRAEDQQPLAGARLRVVLAGKHQPWNPKTRAAAEAVTDAEGRFALAGLEAGAFVLLIEHPGRAPAWSVKVEVSAAGLDLGTLALPAAARLSGRVLGRDDRPRAGITVALVPRDEDRAASGTRFPDLDPAGSVPAAHSTVSDADGRFELSRLPPGDWDLVAASRGILARRSVHLGAGKEAREDLVLDGGRLGGRVLLAGAPLGGASLALQEYRPGSAPIEHQLDDKGELAGVSVYGRIQGAPPRYLYAVTAADGSYEFPAVPPGESEIRVRHPGLLALRRLSVGDRNEERFDIEVAADAVRGQVVTGADDAPLPHARIGLAEGDGTCCHWFLAGADGAFLVSLPGRAPWRIGLDGSSDDVDLDPAAPGYGQSVLLLRARPQDTPHEQQPTLRVRATSGDGRPLDSFRLAYRGERGSGMMSVTDRLEAVLRIDAGRYHVLVASGDRVAPLTAIDLVAPGFELNAVLGPPGEIDVVVPGGSSPGALEVADEAGNVLTYLLRHCGLVTERQDGALLRVPPGTYRLLLRDGERLGSALVAVRAGDRVPVALGLE